MTVNFKKNFKRFSVNIAKLRQVQTILVICILLIGVNRWKCFGLLFFILLFLTLLKQTLKFFINFFLCFNFLINKSQSRNFLTEWKDNKSIIFSIFLIIVFRIVLMVSSPLEKWRLLLRLSSFSKWKYWYSFFFCISSAYFKGQTQLFMFFVKKLPLTFECRASVIVNLSFLVQLSQNFNWISTPVMFNLLLQLYFFPLRKFRKTFVVGWSVKVIFRKPVHESPLILSRRPDTSKAISVDPTFSGIFWQQLLSQFQ